MRFKELEQGHFAHLSAKRILLALISDLTWQKVSKLASARCLPPLSLTQLKQGLHFLAPPSTLHPFQWLGMHASLFQTRRAWLLFISKINAKENKCVMGACKSKRQCGLDVKFETSARIAKVHPTTHASPQQTATFCRNLHKETTTKTSPLLFYGVCACCQHYCSGTKGQ